MSLLRGSGRRTTALRRTLRQREGASPGGRLALDARVRAALARTRAIVYTDTADFTRRAVRDGILHFMMVFDRAVRALRPAAARHRGRIVKVEADSLLLSLLLTPAAAEALPPAVRRRLAPYAVVDYSGRLTTVRRLRLPR